MHRLFVALRPPDWMRRQLAGLMTGVPGARWQADDQLHLTLRFIGEVDRPVAEDIAAALDGVTGPAPTFALNGAGSFGRPRPHTLWAGVRADAALKQLHDRIDRALIGVGLQPDGRAFTPHVTVARLGRSVSSVDRWLADMAGLSSPPAEVSAFMLFESYLSAGGATYTQVARYQLRPAS
jgi:RNA 2',3'-cyclic 3'-phosphodiesterase